MGAMKVKLLYLSKFFIAAFLRDANIFRKFMNKIALFDFDSIQKGLNVLFSCAIDFFKQYNKLPDKDVLILLIDDKSLSEDNKKVLVSIINEVYQLDFQNQKYLVDLFRKEMAKMLFQALKEIDFETDEIDQEIGYIKKILKEIADIKMDDEYWSLIDTFDKREQIRQQRKENPQLQKYLKLGIKDLDEQCKIVPGTITAFLAPFKRYKSLTLTHVGWASLLQGYNVLHIHFEGNREMWESRYDARFTEVDYNKIVSYMRTDKDQQQITRVFEKLKKWKHKLFLMRGFPYKTNVDDIERVIEQIKIEFDIDINVIIIDYFQIMGGSNQRLLKGDEDWLIQGNIAWDLVRLANKGNRIVVGALQTKMSGLSVSSLKSEHLSRSIIYNQAIDNLIAINQTVDEFNEGVIRFSPLFIRDGEIKKEHCKVQSELWKIKIAKEADILWEMIL